MPKLFLLPLLQGRAEIGVAKKDLATVEAPPAVIVFVVSVPPPARVGAEAGAPKAAP